MQDFDTKVIALVRDIPRGKVITYGRIAALAGYPGSARHVSRVLNKFSSEKNLPWHRVINAQGGISLTIYNGKVVQRDLLEEEGILFSKTGKIDLEVYSWR